jgi:hypothetical protein
MSDVETCSFEGFIIHVRGVPTGHTWAAEYAVSAGEKTVIDWKRASIFEGLPTHAAAIHAAFECARADIDDNFRDFPDRVDDQAAT